MANRHYTLDMVEYLKEDDLMKFDIMRIPEVVAPSLNFDNVETYYFYLDYNKDKITDEERQFYLQIIEDIKGLETAYIELALEKLKLSSVNIDE